MKFLEFNDNYLFLKAKKGASLENAINEVLGMFREHDLLEEIDFEFSGYLFVFEKETSSKDVVQMIVDYNYFLTTK